MARKAFAVACLSLGMNTAVLAEPDPSTDQPAAGVQLQSLPAVRDVRLGHTNWLEAARTAEEKISDPGLRAQLDERLKRLAPEVANSLMADPAESGVVTIAVYQRADSGKQEAATAAFEGRGDQLEPSFFARVLADLPGPQPQTGEATLALDSPGSSYLVFFLDKGDLKAGVVSYDRMKEGLGFALNQARPPAPDVAYPTVRASTGSLDLSRHPEVAQEAPEERERATRYAAAQRTRDIVAIAPGLSGNFAWEPNWAALNAPAFIAPSQTIGETRLPRTETGTGASVGGAPSVGGANPGQPTRTHRPVGRPKGTGARTRAR